MEQSDFPEAAAETFSLLSNDIRCAIVRELAVLSTEQWGYSRVPYSKLREAVDVEDGGKFNYHLQQLRGELVEQVDETYQLTRLGSRIAHALLAGTFTGASSVEGETGTCSTCGRTTVLRCENGYLTLNCPEHGTLFDMIVPPRVVEGRSADELAVLGRMRADWHVELAMRGCCHDCWGHVSRTAPVPAADVPMDAPSDDVLLVEFDCDRCANRYWLSPGICVKRHPAVVGFLYDHGETVLGSAPRAFAFTRRSYDDVWETDAGLAIAISRADETLALELDESATVVRVDRG